MSVLSDMQQQHETPVGTGPVVLPRVNLLPPEIAERARFRRVQLALSGGVLATLGVAALLYVSAAAGLSEASSDLEAASTTGAQLRTESARYADVTAVYARAAEAEAMLTEALGQEIQFSKYLNDLSLTIPENVWLRDVSFTQAVVPPSIGSTEPGVGKVSFTGVGFKHEDVAVWLESLARQKGYKDPYFSGSAEAYIGSRKTVTFTSTVTMTPATLSQRYTAPAGG